MSVQEKMTAIADAIRGKTGGTESLTLDQMATEIAGISAGGGDTLTRAILEDTLTELNSAEITKLVRYALYGRKSLTKVDLPNCDYMDYNALDSCSNLTEIRMENYTGTKDTTTQNNIITCTSLETVYMPNCTEVNAQKFRGCTALKNLTLSTQLTRVNGSAFKGTGLEEFIYPSVTTIYNEVFRDCPNLKKVDITNSSWHIEGALCTNASALETFILRSTTMLTLSGTNAFAGTPIASGTGYIYVPSALVDSYKAAANWSTYADQIRAIEDYPEITGG